MYNFDYFEKDIKNLKMDEKAKISATLREKIQETEIEMIAPITLPERYFLCSKYIQIVNELFSLKKENEKEKNEE